MVMSKPLDCIKCLLCKQVKKHTVDYYLYSYKSPVVVDTIGFKLLELSKRQLMTHNRYTRIRRQRLSPPIALFNIIIY